MSKEMHRYSLCWDIYGGTESVTLTLTWKINCDKSSDTGSDSNTNPNTNPSSNDLSYEANKQKHQQQLNKLLNSDQIVNNMSVSSSLLSANGMTNMNGGQEATLKKQLKNQTQQPRQQLNLHPAANKNNSKAMATSKQMQHAKLDALSSNFAANASNTSSNSTRYINMAYMLT